MRRALFAWVAGAVLTFASLASTASARDLAPLEYLAPDHPAYADLETLYARGLIDSLNLSVRPCSRHRIATVLHRAVERSPEAAGDPVLRRMLREFALELTRLDPDTPYRETRPLMVLEGEDSMVRVLPGVDLAASGVGFDDLAFDIGSAGFLEFEWMAEPGFYATAEVLAQKVDPDRISGDTLIKGENLLVDTEEAYLSLSSRHVDALLGYTRARWGPGRTGTLMVSDEAPSYGVLRFEATVAGRLELAALSGVLSQPDRHYFAAHRATFHLTPNLSLGISEAVRYDSESVGMLYLINLIPYSVVHKIQEMDGDGEEAVESRNNVMMGLDLDWRMRPGWRLFGEILVDDLATESDGMPNRMAGQLGVQHARTYRGMPASAVVEVTKVLRYTYATFYDRDFILAGEPLGYVSGPDTERYWAEIRLDPAVDWSGSVTVDFLREGRGFLGEFWSPAEPEDPWGTLGLSSPVTRTVDLAGTVAWMPRDVIRAELGLGYRWTTGDGDDVLVRSGLFWRF